MFSGEIVFHSLFKWYYFFSHLPSFALFCPSILLHHTQVAKPHPSPVWVTFLSLCTLHISGVSWTQLVCQVWIDAVLVELRAWSLLDGTQIFSLCQDTRDQSECEFCNKCDGRHWQLFGQPLNSSCRITQQCCNSSILCRTQSKMGCKRWGHICFDINSKGSVSIQKTCFIHAFWVWDENCTFFTSDRPQSLSLPRP